MATMKIKKDDMVQVIAGQKAVVTRAKKSVATSS